MTSNIIDEKPKEIIPYVDFIPEEDKDIMKIPIYPSEIRFDNFLLSNSINKVKKPKLFVQVDTEDNNRFTKSIVFVVKKLVPEFKNVSGNDMTFRHFTEGITNKLICVTDVNTGFSVNVRTYGKFTEFLIDRNIELEVFKAASDVILYGTFLNGEVYSFIKGRTLVIGDLIDLKTFSLTAQSIARHHHIDIPMVKTPMLFITLRKWLKNVPLEYVDSKKEAYDLNILKKEFVFLEENLSKRSDVVLCHNDLLLKNFIKGDGVVSLIDYEYSSYNYRAFDIANHFNEWCGFELNWDNFPNEETQKRYIGIYLEYYYNKKESELVNEINQLYEDVKWFELASNYFWGLWALIQGALSSIDFDYVGYAKQRFTRYFERKKLLLNQ